MNKWSSFSAVIDGNILINEIQKEKNKISKPLLSEEQFYQIETSVIEAFVNKIKIIVYLYKAGYIYKSEGIITHINKNNKEIIINSQKKVHFKEIVKIKTIDY